MKIHNMERAGSRMAETVSSLETARKVKTLSRRSPFILQKGHTWKLIRAERQPWKGPFATPFGPNGIP
jgi:hypothetical protein